MSRLAGKVALITGTGVGMGRAEFLFATPESPGSMLGAADPWVASEADDVVKRGRDSTYDDLGATLAK